MCQSKPGPRCSNHTAKELSTMKELARKDPHRYGDKLFISQLDYYSTKKGQAELEDSIQTQREKTLSYGAEHSEEATWQRDKLRKLNRIHESANARKDSIDALVKINKDTQNGSPLTASGDASFLQKAAHSPRINDDMADKFMESGETDYMIARNPNLTPSSLDKLAANGSKRAKESVGANPSLDDSTQIHIATQGSTKAKKSLASNQNLTQESKQKLLSNSSSEVLKILAHRRDNTPADAQAIIYSKASTADIVSAVASKTTAYSSTIEIARHKAEADPSYDRIDKGNVYYSVGGNSNAHPETLDSMIGKEGYDAEVEEQIAHNPNAQTSTLKKFKYSDQRKIRQGLSENPNTTNEMLEDLVNDEDSYTREKALERLA